MSGPTEVGGDDLEAALEQFQAVSAKLKGKG